MDKSILYNSLNGRAKIIFMLYLIILLFIYTPNPSFGQTQKDTIATIANVFPDKFSYSILYFYYVGEIRYNKFKEIFLSKKDE